MAWTRFQDDDCRRWWFSDADQDFFYEDDSGPWLPFLDPLSGQKYWWNSSDHLWFFTGELFPMPSNAFDHFYLGELDGTDRACNMADYEDGFALRATIGVACPPPPPDRVPQHFLLSDSGDSSEEELFW